MRGRALSCPLLAAEATFKGTFVQDGEAVPLSGQAAVVTVCTTR